MTTATESDHLTAAPWLRDAPLMYGCMNVGGTWKQPRDDGHESIIAAFETGFRVFDHADIYGGGRCEEAHAQALRECPALAQCPVISKAGHVFGGQPHYYDTSPEHLIASAERSRERLGVERIDLFLIHRYDPLLDARAVGAALHQLHQRGVIAAAGVSNFLPEQMRLLQAHCPLPLMANQIRCNPLDQSAVTDGTLDHCQAAGIVPMAWSPLAKGVCATGVATPADDADGRAATLQSTMDAIAETIGATRTQVALAWLRRHPAGIVPVVGTTNHERIHEAWGASTIELDRVDWFRISIAGRGQGWP